MADDIFDRMKIKADNSNIIAVGVGDDIFDRFKVPTKDTLIPPPKNPIYSKSLEAGGKRGVLDVSDSLDPLLQPSVGRLLNLPPTDEMRNNRRQQYEKEYGDDAIASVGRLGGQILATAPATPTGAIARAFGSAPTIAATGQKIVAPMLNRLGATMTTGAAGGTVYGAGTNSTNEDGLASNIVSNAAAGTVGAPIVAGAGKLGAMVIPGLRSLNANVQVLNAARNAGLPATAITATIKHLEDAGLSPAEAIQELNKLGSRATLGDIDPALQARVSGLSQLGGKPTSILRTRYSNRADTADNAARRFVDSNLGPKPDLEAEGNAIYDMAQKLAGPNYNKAHASTDKLDISNLIGHIDNELKNAVGSRATVLKEIKGYLFNDVKNVDGTVTKAPKETVAQLHPIREEIDDILKKRGEGLSANTFGKVNTIRGKLDDILKTNPEMEAADEIFSKHMNIKSGLQIGYDALTKKTNKDEFIKTFNAASPELQNTIKKGLHAAMIDAMENASAGQEAATRRLFNKKDVNKEILRAAFGTRGDSIIDTVHNEITQRETERLAKYGSQTALNTAIREEYKGKSDPHLGDLSFGAAMDALGSGGMATGAALLKRGVTNRVINFSENRLGRLTEGTADLLSRQGVERDTGMQVIDQVNKIQNRLLRPSKIERLPLPKIPTFAAPFGGETYAKIKDKTQ